MDPDVVLYELRRLCEAALDGMWAAGDHNMEEIAEKFQALDQWLSKGGFFPHEWENIVTLRLRKIIEAAHEEGHGALSTVINAVDAANREGVINDHSHHVQAARLPQEPGPEEAGAGDR